MYAISYKCPPRSEKCEACGESIPEDTWRVIVAIPTDDGEKRHVVHDNEGACRDRFLVSNHLIQPTFMSTRTI